MFLLSLMYFNLLSKRKIITHCYNLQPWGEQQLRIQDLMMWGELTLSAPVLPLHIPALPSPALPLLEGAF